jgi:hypothetical protein
MPRCSVGLITVALGAVPGLVADMLQLRSTIAYRHHGFGTGGLDGRTTRGGRGASRRRNKRRKSARNGSCRAAWAAFLFCFL